MQFLSKFSKHFCGCGIDKIILIFIWRSKKTRTAKVTFKKKTKVRVTNISNFKMCHLSTVIDTLGLVEGQIHRSMEQNRKHRNRPTKTMLNWYFTEVQKQFNKWCWRNWITIANEINLSLSHTYTTINSMWIPDINVKHKTFRK